MNARARTEPTRDSSADAKERSGGPHSGANAFLQFPIGKMLPFVVRRPGIHEDAVAKPGHSQRRGRWNPQLDGAGAKRVANAVARAKAPQIARSAKDRFVEIRRGTAEIFPHRSHGEDHPSVEADIAICVDLLLTAVVDPK